MPFQHKSNQNLTNHRASAHQPAQRQSNSTVSGGLVTPIQSNMQSVADASPQQAAQRQRNQAVQRKDGRQPSGASRQIIQRVVDLNAIDWGSVESVTVVKPKVASLHLSNGETIWVKVAESTEEARFQVDLANVIPVFAAVKPDQTYNLATPGVRKADLNEVNQIISIFAQSEKKLRKKPFMAHFPGSNAKEEKRLEKWQDSSDILNNLRSNKNAVVLMTDASGIKADAFHNEENYQTLYQSEEYIRTLAYMAIMDPLYGNYDRMARYFAPQNYLIDNDTQTINLIDNTDRGAEAESDDQWQHQAPVAAIRTAITSRNWTPVINRAIMNIETECGHGQLGNANPQWVTVFTAGLQAAVQSIMQAAYRLPANSDNPTERKLNKRIRYMLGLPERWLRA